MWYELSSAPAHIGELGMATKPNILGLSKGIMTYLAHILLRS